MKAYEICTDNGCTEDHPKGGLRLSAASEAGEWDLKEDRALRPNRSKSARSLGGLIFVGAGLELLAEAKPTVAELEAILQGPEPDVALMPNGQLTVKKNDFAAQPFLERVRQILFTHPPAQAVTSLLLEVEKETIRQMVAK